MTRLELPEAAVGLCRNFPDALNEIYKLECFVGQGAFSTVWRAMHRTSGQSRAIKKIDTTDLSPREVAHEIAIMRFLRHENVVRCYDVFMEGQFVSVVMDLFNGGDLVDGLNLHRRAQGRLRNWQLRLLAKQMTAAVCHVHSLQIIHRDVKGENFLSDRPNIGDPHVRVLFLLPCLSSTQQADALLADDECRDANGQPCALSTLQLNGRGRALVGCHTTVRGERCFREIQWARTVGMRSHPEWYPNLTLESSLLDFQKFLYERYPGKCPIPCGVPLPRKWCLWPNATNLSAPSAGPALSIKVLSYNLFWWNLYRVRQGEGDSAGNLIKSEISEDQPFDVMGFQECESGIRVLEPVGLLEIFEVLQGPHATCLAYRKGWWRSLANGSIDVGEDMRSHYYGRRRVQWIRLEHNTTGRKLLFMNHHGPLEINSGGSCGGPSMANNILRVMQNQSQPGDAVILVGDFNANSASLTIQALWSRMVLLQSGTSFGGVDNIFGNMDSNSVISRKNLGSGGSDHDAIACTVALGNPLANGSAPAPVAPVGAIGDDPITVRANITGISTAVQAAETLLSNPPGTRWQSFWCGLLESDIGYVPVNDSWFRTVRHRPNFGDSNDVASPQRCCRLCQQEPRCKSWTWKDGGPKRCEMFGSAPASKEVVPGYVSGLSAAEASLEAARSALRALSGLS